MGAQVAIASTTMRLGAARRLLTAADTVALHARCRQPIVRADLRYCTALLRTLARCRRHFGRFTLRCGRTGATACSTGLAEIRDGHCGACNCASGEGPA